MYDIDFKPIKKRKEKDISFIVFGILFIFVLLYFVYGIGNGNLLILGAIFPMFLFPMLFIIIGIFNLNKTNKRIKIINELNKTGKLIKGLPYKLEHTNIKRNNMVISVPAVDYQLPDGTIVHLTALTCYHYSNKDKDGLADLIIEDNTVKGVRIKEAKYADDEEHEFR